MPKRSGATRRRIGRAICRSPGGSAPGRRSGKKTSKRRAYARRGVEASLAVGDRWHLAYGRNQQGHVAAARNAFAEARRHYEAGLAIREEFDDPEGVGTGLGHLANVAARQDDWAEAEQLYRRSLAIAREIGDRAAQANALNGLGRAACAAGDFAAAGRYLAEGLELVVQARFVRFLISFLVSTGEWLLRTGRVAAAIEPLTLARDHPASNLENRSAAQQLLDESIRLARDSPVEIPPAPSGGDPILLAQRLLIILSEPSIPAMPDSAPTQDAAPTAAPPPAPGFAAPPDLVEPLSEREVAVLRLIAAGRSNREIADELFLALNTVRSYSHQLYGKLGVGSRTQAIARARELHLLD
ncbi:MAG: LuxR C-terminal-related transcriptional regulator [Thermomicrobiales bacterium]